MKKRCILALAYSTKGAMLAYAASSAYVAYTIQKSESMRLW